MTLAYTVSVWRAFGTSRVSKIVGQPWIVHRSGGLVTFRRLWGRPLDKGEHVVLVLTLEPGDPKGFRYASRELSAAEVAQYLRKKQPNA